MNSKERVLQREQERGRPAGQSRGRSDALDLAGRAANMDGTAIIAEQEKVPLFVPDADYSGCPTGSPIGEIIDGEVQIFTMITPVNTAHYPGITPNTERSLFSLCHTTDPARAKPFLAPQGISGLYRTGECCTDAGHIWQNLFDGNGFRPADCPERWQDLGPVE